MATLAAIIEVIYVPLLVVPKSPMNRYSKLAAISKPAMLYRTNVLPVVVSFVSATVSFMLS